MPPLPPGTFDVVLLLETMLAFRDKATLLQGISGALTAGGRFAFTLEEGLPLTEPERERMPDADTVWLTPVAEMRALLERAGLVVSWQADWSGAHRALADALIDAFAADATAIAARIGRRALDELPGISPALERVARDGARPQDRVRGGEAVRPATRGTGRGPRRAARPPGAARARTRRRGPSAPGCRAGRAARCSREGAGSTTSWSPTGSSPSIVRRSRSGAPVDQACGLHAVGYCTGYLVTPRS